MLKRAFGRGTRGTSVAARAISAGDAVGRAYGRSNAAFRWLPAGAPRPSCGVRRSWRLASGATAKPKPKDPSAVVVTPDRSRPSRQGPGYQIGQSILRRCCEPYAVAIKSLEGVGSLAPWRRPTSSFSEFNLLAVKPFLVKLAVQHARARPLAPALSLGAYKHHTRNPTGRKHPCPPTRKPRTRLAGSIRTFLLSPLKE